MTLTYGSLFSGIAGLDLAVEETLSAVPAWVCDSDPAAARVLAARWPGVPNLGDITAVDWPAVPSVDVLIGGFPCQDVSVAGHRAGLAVGTRSGLWSFMRDAIAALRPSLVIIENVRGLLSATADSDMEPGRWCLADDPDVPALRAAGAVLGDLASIGFDAEWVGLRAADVGACHGRYRVFIVARPVADAQGHRRNEGRAQPARILRRPDARAETDPHGAAAGRGGRAAADTGGPPRHLPRHAVAGDRPAPDGGRGPAEPGGRGRAAGDAKGGGRSDESVGSTQEGLEVGTVAGAVHRDRERGPAEGVPDLGRTAPVLAWGAYAAAVHRWELILGRPAPAPTEPNTRGGRRLAARFVEWMQGLPDGWVTDVPGLSRNDQLRLLGNSVVPQQAGAGIRILLARAWEGAA